MAGSPSSSPDDPCSFAPVNAAGIDEHKGSMLPLRLDKVAVAGHAGLLVKQVGMFDLGGCGRSDYYILDQDHLFFKEIYAMLLSAHLTDLQVQITATDCVQGISRITHVQISH